VERFRRLAVIGVGLIGGSAALALRRHGLVEEVVGVGRGSANLARAVELGVVDRTCADAARGVEGADAVLVAVPVGQMAAVFGSIAPALAADAFVTDGGSTKQDVVAAARAALGARLPSFVPAHPIAGAEKSGVEAARADLYEGRNVVLTPLPETAPAALDRASAFWAACGARVCRMAAAEHDAVFAAVSHLPHVLAYALVAMVAGRPDAERLFGFAAGGFRDFTRIASSSPEMWRDICISNREALLAEIDRYADELAGMRASVAAADGPALLGQFALARDAREAWLRKIEGGR
jgi:prephenate dehydrogenase